MSEDHENTGESNGFDPSRYLMKVTGQDYLAVKWRLVWLRDAHPDATITTRLLEHDPGKYAIVHAAVSIPGGGGAEGIGSESPSEFRDYNEKAETKAIGRALGALGFGTQFCDDFATGVSQQTGDLRIADSPVSRQPQQAQRQYTPPMGPAPAQIANAPQNGNLATDRQLAWIESLAKRATP